MNSGLFRIFLKWFRKDPFYSFLILLIITLAIFFRTYSYTERIYVQADNSRDVQVARYAADYLKIPQIGQFSSAGPFFYGPWYYWFLEIVSFLPFGFLTHWYVITAIYLISIFLIFWLGDKMGGRWVGALAALFAAISPAQINYSFSVWNPAIVPFLVILSLILLVKFAKSKKAIFIFALGFIVSLAITVHFQSMLILPTLIVAMFSFKQKPRQFLKNFLFLALGFAIPLLPLLYFDWHHNWYEAISLFIYLTIDQYRIWVPNRWLTYIGTYWPDAWSFIVGGNRLFAGIIIVLLSFFTLLKLKDFAKNKIFFLLAITFVLEIIMFRYYRGERFQYYSLFAHPSVIILTAWVLAQVFKIQRVVGVVLMILIFLLTTKGAFADIRERQISYPKINNLKKEIYAKYPNEKFDIYGCLYNPDLVSHPLALFLYYEGRNEVDGVKIGVCSNAESGDWTILSPEAVRRDNGNWFNISTPIVYKSTVEWWQEKPPGKGDFWKFVKEKFNLSCYPHC